jgi:hypothetical protein
MTRRDGFDGVEVLLPARVHQERERFVAALRAELAAIIAALPTAAGTGQGQGAVPRTPPTRNPRETEDRPS